MDQDLGRSVPDGLSSATPIEPVPVSPLCASIPSADEIGSWEDNARFLLANCPHTIRGHEGGGPENLIVSLVLTFGKMQSLIASQKGQPDVE